MLRRKFDADLHNKIGKMFAQGDKIWWEIMCHKDWDLMAPHLNASRARRL